VAKLPLHYRSAIGLGRKLARRKVDAPELLELMIDRVERHDEAINAVVVRDFDKTRVAALAAHKRLKAGEARSPIDGVPVTVKESFDWAGTASTWGSPVYANNVAATTAVAVQRLEDAGAVVFGKTNVPLMLADWQSYNAVYGTTNNPWDLARSPGGSSGGSAASLAAGFSALELGSDIGASIRNPAHYCGVFGHKPTYGIVPMRGHLLPGAFAYADISCGGPLARSAADLALALKLIAGPHGPQARQMRFRLAKPRFDRLSEARVAVMLDDPSSEVDEAVKDRITALGRFLEPRVKALSWTARPAFDTGEANELYIRLLRAATSARQSDADFAANLSRLGDLDPADRSYLALMTQANTMRHRDWLKLNNRRHELRLAWDRFFGDWDVLLCPAAASAAFPHDQKGERHERTIEVNGHRVPTTDQLFWAGFPCGFYLPSTVAPAGLTPGGLPVGVQIISAEHADLTAIRTAELIEAEYGGFLPPPGFP
jgi:amidase